jgi:hypothetical protein
MKASDELSAEEIRQLTFEIETSYLAFQAALAKKR